MAHIDWTFTGQTVLLDRFSAVLQANTYSRFIDNSTGLVTKPSPELPTRDIVDWPANSRDGYVFTRVNTVVNSYAAQTNGMLGAMGVAGATAKSETIRSAMDAYLFDRSRGRYCDGRCPSADRPPPPAAAEAAAAAAGRFGAGDSGGQALAPAPAPFPNTTNHTALHATIFPLAFVSRPCF
jgi:hypothetical protein